MITIVFMGLTISMDFYHIGLLFFFVFYMIAPKRFRKNIIYLVLYASFFILEKYIYTLIEQILKDKICYLLPDGKTTLTC